MNDLKIFSGQIDRKKINTPNDFISHMVEQLAWRAGFGIDLNWENDDWEKLGRELGRAIAGSAGVKRRQVVFLGMIDDGLAKARIAVNRAPGFSLKGREGIDFVAWRDSRVEQLASGQALVDLAEGLAQGLKMSMEVVVLNQLDPHHAWESIFRSLGVCLGKILDLKKQGVKRRGDKRRQEKRPAGMMVLEKTWRRATVKRDTAESRIVAKVDCAGDPWQSCFVFQTGASIQRNLRNLDKLLGLLAEAAGMKLELDFRAMKLASSHVVLEDSGLVLGRALLEVLKIRFEQKGANGAGSSLTRVEDFSRQNGAVAISVEGRKFCELVPARGDWRLLNRKFRLYQDVLGGIPSEDLDDFLDGLAGGMGAGLMVVVDRTKDADSLWQEVFRNLGRALKETFEIKAGRRGMPPGVKATLS